MSQTLPQQNVASTTAASTTLIGPFTARDTLVLLSTAILFVASFFPVYMMQISDLKGPMNLWRSGALVILFGLFFAVAGCVLMLLRRTRKTETPIGSLSTDQFASVAGTITLLFYISFPFTLSSWTNVTTIANGSKVLNFNVTHGYWLALLGSVIYFIATTLAPRVPVLKNDFEGRAEVPAHLIARPAVVPTAKAPNAATLGNNSGNTSGKSLMSAFGKRGKDAQQGLDQLQHDTNQQAGMQGGLQQQAQPQAQQRRYTGKTAAELAAGAQAYENISPQQNTAQAGGQQAGVQSGLQQQTQQQAQQTHFDNAAQSAEQSILQEAHAQAAQPAQAVAQPFWFAVPTDAQLTDQMTGKPFTLVPGEWHLALEDRGNSFLVQSEDHVGVLHDITNVQRA